MGTQAGRAYRRVLRPIAQAAKRRRFGGSEDYWEKRYESGGDSGPGSYGELAEFKAATLNEFVARHAVQSVIEFGVGDGNQLSLGQYPRYMGLDVATGSIQRCIDRFSHDPTKSFMLYSTRHFLDRARLLHAELTMSLDVLFHLVEDDIFDAYMRHLFGSADRLVAIYASDEERPQAAAHVRHRAFSPWIAQHMPDWEQIEIVENPLAGIEDSIAHFAFYGRRA